MRVAHPTWQCSVSYSVGDEGGGDIQTSCGFISKRGMHCLHNCKAPLGLGMCTFVVFRRGSKDTLPSCCFNSEQRIWSAIDETDLAQFRLQRTCVSLSLARWKLPISSGIEAQTQLSVNSFPISFFLTPFLSRVNIHVHVPAAVVATCTYNVLVKWCLFWAWMWSET